MDLLAGREGFAPDLPLQERKRPRCVLRLSLRLVAENQRRIQKNRAASSLWLLTTETQSRFHSTFQQECREINDRHAVLKIEPSAVGQQKACRHQSSFLALFHHKFNRLNRRL